MILRQIINAVGAFTKLASSDMGLSSAYRLQKLIGAVQTELDFFSSKRNQILSKYGTIQEDNSVDITEENAQLAKVEIEELLEVEVMPDFTRLSLPLSEHIQLSANDVEALAYFVDFTDD